MIFIAPELVLIFFIVLLNLYASKYLIMLGTQFQANDEIWKFLPTLPILFSGFAFKASSKLRAPLDSASNKILYEWPLYHMITDRVMLSKVYCLVCCAGAISIWLFCKQLPASFIASIFLVSTLVSGATALLIHEASQKLREVIELNT